MKKNNKKGFTLAELLIVVAIIAVLVAIAIPVFTTQLEKSRDAVSISNLRSAYAEAQAAYLTGGNGGDTHITYSIGTDGSGTIKVANVAIKSQQANKWSDLAGELAFVGGTNQMSKDAFEALDTGSTITGSKEVTFTYNANAIITTVAIG